LWQLFIWVPYILAFTVLFYRRARGLWVGVMFMTGGVYPDPDYEREYFAPHAPMEVTDRLSDK
jgi:hypothetical protein